MEIPLDKDRATYLLKIIEYYTAEHDIDAESWEATFLIDIMERLKRRLRRGS